MRGHENTSIIDTEFLLPSFFSTEKVPSSRYTIESNSWNCESKWYESRSNASRVSFCTVNESESEIAQSCLTLCDPMDCSLPSSSVHGIFQARILEWVAISFSRASSQPKDWTHVSCIDKQILYHCATWEINETNILERGDAILHMPGKRRNRILANTPNGSHVCLWNKSTLGSVEEFTSYRQINAQNNRLKSN